MDLELLKNKYDKLPNEVIALEKQLIKIMKDKEKSK